MECALPGAVSAAIPGPWALGKALGRSSEVTEWGSGMKVGVGGGVGREGVGVVLVFLQLV